MNKNTPIATAEKLAREAGKIIQDLLHTADIEHKASNNLVTEADLSAEKHIINNLQKLYPTHQFLGEESENEVDINADDLWIIDPLDGTNNFAHGLPHYAVSIAHAQKGDIVTAVCYDPVRDELFRAQKGLGAFLNNKKIAVSSAETIKQAIVATGFFYDRGKIMQQTLRSIETLFEQNIQGIRRIGAAVLDMCWVACGRMDAYFEYFINPWDYSAAWLIATEAGAICAGPDGSPMKIDSHGVICATPAIFDTFVDLVQWKNQG